MFTKLKQKIADEDHSDIGSSLASSPSSSRKYRREHDNKWQRRRLNSVSTYYGSRESVFTEPSVLLSRDSSFTTNEASKISTSSHNSNKLSNPNKPRKDLMAILHEKTLEIDKLQRKLSDYKEEIQKWRNLYEEQSMRQIEQTKNLERKRQLSRTEIDAKQTALDILERSTQLADLEQSYKEQKQQLSTMMTKLDELTQQRCMFETEENKLKQRTVNLETENKTLKEQLNDLITEVTQKSVEKSKLEKCLQMRETELNQLQETHDEFKKRISSEISEKDMEIRNLTSRLANKESARSDYDKSEDEWLPDCLNNSGDKSSEINALATLVGSLNEKLERKDKELTSCKRVAEETIDDLKKKMTELENELVDKERSEEGSNDQLEALQQRNSYLERELENVRSQLTTAKRSKETKRQTWLRSGEQRHEEKSRLSEKEVRQLEARYESQLADIREERDQLQSELMTKDEECAQVSMCLEDALNNTGDLKNQIRELEKALEKTNATTVTRKIMEPSSLTANVEIMEALRRELEESKENNRHINDILRERDDAVTSLQNEITKKNEDIRFFKNRLLQFEDNNILADRSRLAQLEDKFRDPYKQISSLRTRLKGVDVEENLRGDVEIEKENLVKQINEKDVRIRALQQKLVDLKKAFQREIKASSDCVEINGTTNGAKNGLQPGLLVSSSSQTDNEEFDYLNMNFKYLKHVIIKYMCSSNEKSRQMLPILGHLLRLTPKEIDLITETFEWKLPLDY